MKLYKSSAPYVRFENLKAASVFKGMTSYLLINSYQTITSTFTHLPLNCSSMLLESLVSFVYTIIHVKSNNLALIVTMSRINSYFSSGGGLLGSDIPT
jgi:hypothetical protein